MPKTFSDLLAHLAEHASFLNEEILSHLCRMGALHAQKRNVPGPQTLLGVFDWDIPNDRNHLDANSAELFGVDPRRARKGVANVEYMSAIHPSDVAHTAQSIEQILQRGGETELEYRLITGNRTRWILAKGICTLDSTGKPERFAGAMLELPNLCATRKQIH